MYWDYAGPTVIADTSSLTTRRPWYSMVYNDAVQGLALSPYGMTDASRYQVQHLAGQKQYEFTNHLGNVQATISDLPVKVGEAHTEYHAPALPAVYDYYPFGMLMPDRYTSDTSSECVTVSQSKWVTTWVTHCYLAADWVWPAYSYYGSVSVSTSSGLQIAAGESSGIYFEIDVLPYEQQDVYLQTDAFYSGSGTLELQEYHGGQWMTLGSTTFDKLGEVRISIRPREDRIRAVLRGPFYVQVKQFCVQRPQLSQETVLVDICDTDGDKYRFGFNGMEKVNEWSGVGNHLDYKFRGYDSRIARFISADPIITHERKYPELTPYQFASNTPIRALDLEGLQAVGWEAQWERNARLQALDGDDEKLRDLEYKEGVGMGAALIIGLTRGKALSFLNLTTAAGLIEHNRPKTPEARAVQNKRFSNGVQDLAVGIVAGKVASVMTKTIGRAGHAIYKSFAANSIRFSQSSVKGSDYAVVKRLMSEGKDLGKIDIVKMRDGIYTTLDNKRLLAAKELGKDIKATSHNYDDALDEVNQSRFFEQYGKKVDTWGEAVELRTSSQAKYISRDSPSGSFINPKVSGN
jgi:RHS repeat-associated protein